MIHAFRHPQRASLARGFSLVETALALGIIAFALMALVALLPAGLGQFREAMDKSIGAQIFQRVVTDAEQMEFDSLLAGGTGTGGTGAAGGFFALPTRYFDDQGNEVLATETTRIIYHARVRVAPPGPATVQARGTDFTSLPGGPGESRFAPRDAVFLTVQVAHYPLPKALEAGPNALWLRTGTQRLVPMQTYSAVVTRTGFAKSAAK